MSDISKCDGKDCAKAKMCWRYLAPSSAWQSYISPEKRGDKCKMFWANPQGYPEPIPPFSEENA